MVGWMQSPSFEDKLKDLLEHVNPNEIMLTTDTIYGDDWLFGPVGAELRADWEHAVRAAHWIVWDKKSGLLRLWDLGVGAPTAFSAVLGSSEVATVSDLLRVGGELLKRWIAASSNLS